VAWFLWRGCGVGREINAKKGWIVFMGKSENVILTALCMVTDGNQILLQDRVKEDWRGFTFPGGHVEKSESFVQAIIREIKEETGLTIYNPKLCGIKQFPTEDDERYVVLLFKTNLFSGNLCSSDEGEMYWIDRADLPNTSVAEGFYDVLKVYDEDIAEIYYEHNEKNDTWIAKWF